MTTLQPSALLSDYIEMGVVELLVKDLARQRHFYEELVGLEVIEEAAAELLLGFAGRPIIKLITSTLPPAAAGSAGLYHTATVFEHRPALAQALKRILSDLPELYTGSADHLVSEAFYFNDPEGNGVELYFDKDPQTWAWHNGHIMMDSLYLDIREYITRYEPLTQPLTKKMGHVHLKIGNIGDALHFYREILGFRLVAQFPSALFISDGQYHHHLGMNVWESLGAGIRKPSLGLKSLTIKLATATDLERLQNRLTANGIQFVKEENSIIVNDPWGNKLKLTNEA